MILDHPERWPILTHDNIWCLCSSSDHASSRSAFWSRFRVSSSPLSPIWPDVAAQVALFRASRIAPATKLRVAPTLQSFLPCQRMDLRVAPILASFSLALRKSPGCPGSPLPALPSMSGRVAPYARSSGCTGDGGFESPRISRPSAVLSVTPRVAPARRCSSLCR
jgi:hypothetical protein